jgi:chaperonin GroES
MLKQTAVKQYLTLKLNKMAQLKGKILAGKVLVKPNEAEAKTASGIIIPDSAKEKPRQGKVVLTGAAKKDEEMEVKKGDEVLYGKYSGQELTIDGEDYLLISQSDVLFIM